MIKFKKLHENAIIPTRATKGSAGHDLHSMDELTLYPQHRYLIKTGVGAFFPGNIVGQIWPRSGLAWDHGIGVMAGVIDSDYETEIKVILINQGPANFEVKVGDRIAQILFLPIVVTAIPTLTERAGGFGSTG